MIVVSVIIHCFYCSYAFDVNIEKAEDVLLHKKLLNMARNAINSTAVDVRLFQVYSICQSFAKRVQDYVEMWLQNRFNKNLKSTQYTNKLVFDNIPLKSTYTNKLVFDKFDEIPDLLY